MRERICNCGSQQWRHAHYDVRGIFLCFACDACWPEKQKSYRADILTDANYWSDEPIDDE